MNMKTFIIETFKMSDTDYVIVRKLNGEPVICLLLTELSDYLAHV